MLKPLSALALIFLAVGCGPETRTYYVTVKNVTATPITLALTKDGPPYEDLWASPEEIVQHRPTQTPGFVDLAPDRGTSIANAKGQFASGTRAVLRIYRGSGLTVQDMLKIRVGPDRQDVTLDPGDNRFEGFTESGWNAACRKARTWLPCDSNGLRTAHQRRCECRGSLRGHHAERHAHRSHRHQRPADSRASRRRRAYRRRRISHHSR